MSLLFVSHVDRLHVDFKKRPCRPVEFKGQGPQSKAWVPLGDTGGVVIGGLEGQGWSEITQFIFHSSTINADPSRFVGPLPIFLVMNS